MKALFFHDWMAMTDGHTGRFQVLQQPYCTREEVSVLYKYAPKHVCFFLFSFFFMPHNVPRQIVACFSEAIWRVCTSRWRSDWAVCRQMQYCFVFFFSIDGHQLAKRERSTMNWLVFRVFSRLISESLHPEWIDPKKRSVSSQKHTSGSCGMWARNVSVSFRGPC